MHTYHGLFYLVGATCLKYKQGHLPLGQGAVVARGHLPLGQGTVVAKTESHVIRVVPCCLWRGFTVFTSWPLVTSL